MIPNYRLLITVYSVIIFALPAIAQTPSASNLPKSSPQPLESGQPGIKKLIRLTHAKAKDIVAMLVFRKYFDSNNNAQNFFLSLGIDYDF